MLFASIVAIKEIKKVILPTKSLVLTGRAIRIESWIETSVDRRVRFIRNQIGHIKFYIDGNFNREFHFSLVLGGRTTTGTLTYLKEKLANDICSIEINLNEQGDSEVEVISITNNGIKYSSRQTNVNVLSLIVAGVVLTTGLFFVVKDWSIHKQNITYRL